MTPSEQEGLRPDTAGTHNVTDTSEGSFTDKTKNNYHDYMLRRQNFLGQTQRSWKHVHPQACTWMSVEALFIIAKGWKQ